MKIGKNIRRFHSSTKEGHHRYCSWEHCYGYFRQAGPKGILREKHLSALHLGFYLASWGMYRGSSFLLQHAYTVHLGVIDALAAPERSILWEREFGTEAGDMKIMGPVILGTVDAIRAVYKPFVPEGNTTQPSDTLITKVLLGALGCLPACDRYFIDGFKSAGMSFSYLNQKFIERVFNFCQENLVALRDEQIRISRNGGMHYPLMKLVDMYFWQAGYERGSKSGSEDKSQK